MNINNKVYLPNNQWATYTNGIVVQNSRNVLVQSNYIEGTGTHWWKSGIRLDKCPGSTVRCNTSSNLGVGLFMTDEQVPVSLKQNEMINNWTGLYLGGGNVGHIGLPQGWYVANWIQNNGAYLPLLAYSASTLAWDNHWVGPFDSDDVISVNVNSHNYNVFARNSNPEWESSPSSNVAPTYTLLTTVATNYLGNISGQDCPTENAGTQEFVWQGGGIEQYKKMLTDTTTQNFTEAYRWSQQFTVYDFLEGMDSIRNTDSLFTTFYESHQTENIGLLYRASKDLGKVSGKVINVDKVLAYKDTLVAITPSNEPETDLITVLTVLADVMLDSPTISLIDSAFIDLAAFDSTLSFSIPNTRLDSATYELVKEIAEKCPYRFGQAVYIARGLAALNDSAGVVYRNECERYQMDTTSMRLEEQTQTLTLPLINFNRLYPNPTYNEVYIDYSLYEGETGSIELINLIGQRVLSIGNILGKGRKSLSFLSLPQGMYFVRLLVNGKIRNQWKLIVKK